MSVEAEVRPISATDRVSDVLTRDESLVEIFVRLGPQFSKLRNRALRRVMARLVTVEQAARMAGVSTAELLLDLNTAIGLAPAVAPTERGASSRDGDERTDSGGRDAESVGAETRDVHPVDARVVEIDVRDDLRAGREPFSRIMAATSALGPGEVVHLRTTFEPFPLYAVMAKRRFLHEAQAHAKDDWSVWFWRPAGAPTGGNAMLRHQGTEAKSATELPAPRPNEIWLDVRGLEPPEPLVRTLAALELLPDGDTLVQINARVPQFLLPMLAERGFACEVDESGTDRVLVRIWRAR